MAEYESTSIYKKTKVGNKIIKKQISISKHRKVWMETFGEIPEDCIIHHKDRDKKNNSLDNLLCLSRRQHALLHWKLRKKREKDKLLSDKSK